MERLHWLTRTKTITLIRIFFSRIRGLLFIALACGVLWVGPVQAQQEPDETASVAEAASEPYNIAEARLVVMGARSINPVASNLSTEGRAPYRRVVFILLDEHEE